MKLVTVLVSICIALTQAQQIHTHDMNEEIYMQGFDYLESVLKVAVRLLHLNERSPRDSHFKEFKMGFFDAAFKF